MCGIVGCYGPFDRTDVVAMTAALAHRGPDDEGIEILAGVREPDIVGLGHRRLSIIDIAGGHQPMWSVDGSVGIVFNGEIYNFRQLRQELESEGACFRTSSDTEVIAEGWRLRGMQILPALSGMFAFGIWDARKHEWILARDRFGIKPLYYAAPRPGRLLFASEIKPLLRTLAIEINRAALYDYLLYGWNSGPETIFAGIKHLPPGHWARWNPGDSAPSPRRYCEVRFAPRRIDAASAARTLRERVDAAVEAHLVADVPVGISLSGGVDSSTLLASMRRFQPAASIDAFTVGFGLADDETPYAQRMAADAGVRHHVRKVDPQEMASNFANLVHAIEEPIAHPVLQTTWAWAQLARKKLKVVLIGEGADELFLGYPQYRLLQSPLRYGPRALLQDYFLRIACLMPSAREIEAMLDPAFCDRPMLSASEHRFDGYFREGDATLGAQAFEFDNALVVNQLMRIDKLTMAHGIEARVPFLDLALVDFALQLPLGLKLRGGISKAVLRQAMTDRLPREIVHRPKRGRGGTQALLPYLNDMVAHGPLSHLVSREAIERRGWLQPDKVLGYLAAAANPQVRYHPIESRRRRKFAYALAVLEQWARQYLDFGQPWQQPRTASRSEDISASCATPSIGSPSA
ncbi:MAG TPA: asparagine synthase (glutamine-hydrolyzing) [Steroidobacteraceae bacterium]|nr:asparagine synthase (glutamine-hydrolyzing) [Steroidobacteraceae bacterium]